MPRLLIHVAYLLLIATGALFLRYMPAQTADDTTSVENAIHGVVIVTTESGLGSGTIIGENYILTNSHVIHGFGGIMVGTQEGNRYSATVIFDDPLFDLAAIKIDDWKTAKKENKFTPLSFASDYKKLETVFSIGHPLGSPFVVSRGVISNPYTILTQKTFGVLTDARIYEGSSGGPIVNIKGEIIGISDQIFVTDGGSLGVAIPGDVVQKLVDDQTKFNENHMERLGIQLNQNGTIKSFEDVSGGRDSGLQVGDFVYSYNKKDVGEVVYIDNNHRFENMQTVRDGEHIVLNIIRKDKRMTLEVIPKTSIWKNNEI
jgi:serine protease Do